MGRKMGIYKSQSIYNQGLTVDELKKLSTSWEDVSTKVFNADSVDSIERNFKFYFNRYLAMCKMTGWARFSGDSTNTRKCISFNTDLPGDQNINLFSFSSIGKLRNSGESAYGVGTVIFRPFAHSTYPIFNNGIYITTPSISNNYVDCIYVISNIDNLLDEFCDYIDNN